MKLPQLIPILLLVAALATAASSFSLGIWAFEAPGAGMFPLLSSVVIICGVLSSQIKPEKTEARGELADRARFLEYCVAIVGFIVAVNIIGTAPAIFLFLSIVLGRIERLGWKRAATIGAISAAVSWGVFRDLLNVPLPHGLWS